VTDDDSGFVDMESIKEASEVGEHGREVVTAVGLVAEGVAALVISDYEVVAGQDGGDEIPDAKGGGKPVHEQKGRSVLGAPGAIVQVDPGVGGGEGEVRHGAVDRRLMLREAIRTCNEAQVRGRNAMSEECYRYCMRGPGCGQA
jgi:hypothetical protein